MAKSASVLFRESIDIVIKGETIVDFLYAQLKQGAEIIESLQICFTKEKQRADRAEKVLELIKRDINEPEKILNYVSDYFREGRAVNMDGNNIEK